MGKFENLYSSEIYEMRGSIPKYDGEYNNIFQADGLGYNCGDILAIKVYLKNDIIHFDAEENCCILAQASLHIMSNLIQGKHYQEILEICTEINKSIQDITKKNKYSSIIEIFESYLPARKKCIRLPWVLMEQATKEISQHNVNSKRNYTDNEDASSMDCDACVKISCVLSNNTYKTSSSDLQSIVSLSTNQTNKIQKAIQKQIHYNPAKLTKLVLSPKEVNYLKILSEKWDTSYTDYFRKIKSIELIYTALKENGLPISPELELLYAYKYEHYKLNLSLWNDVKQIFNTNKIKYIGVKGLTLFNYYQAEKKQRFSSDIDILTPDIFSFLKAISCLFESNSGFELHDKLGLVGSFKIDINHVISGHTHIIKRIMDKTVTIDLSFPNIPNGHYHLLNIDVAYNDNTLSAEANIAFLLTHAFKHSRLPIKEMNDFFLLLRYVVDDIDLIELYKIFNKNKLFFKFALFKQAVFKYYALDENQIKFWMSVGRNAMRDALAKVIIHFGWPYSSLLHQVIRYIFKHTESQSPSYKKSFNPQNHKAIDLLYSKFGNKRFYLIPILEFKKIISIDDIVHSGKFDRYDLCDAWAILVRDQYCYLISKFGVFSLQDNFELADSTFAEWHGLWRGVMNYRYTEDFYKMRLVYLEESGVWMYV